jgi:hypothetical protein
MTGGAKVLMTDMIKKHWTPIEIYILVALTLGIVYVKEIPLKIRRYAETFFGRIILFIGTIAVAHFSSWSNGLLVAIFTLLLLSMSPRTSEGFQSDMKNKIKMVDDNQKWWVERVFKENPIAIEDDEVKTSAIQDASNSSRSSYSQGSSGGP